MSHGIDIPTSGDVVVIGFDSAGAVSTDSAHLPGLLSDLSQQLWSDLRSRLPGLLRDRLGRPDLVGDGFTLYDIDVRVAADCEMTVQRTPEGDLAVHVVSGRNTIIATSTTPTVIGSWGDPRFSLDFGLSFTYLVDVPPMAAPFGATGLNDLAITMPHVDSQNFVADLLFIPVRIAEFFSNWSLDGTLAELLHRADLTGLANAQLTGLNALVGTLASQGYPYLQLLAGDPAALQRQLGQVSAATRSLIADLPADICSLVIACRKPDTSGVIEGEIAWRAGEGRAVDARERAILDTMARPFLDTSGLQLLRTLSEGTQEPGPQPVQGGLQGEQVLVDNAAQRYVVAPTATTWQLDGLESASFARVWDSKGEAPAATGETFSPTAFTQQRFEALLGGPTAYLWVLDTFRRGPQQFDVSCTVPDATGGHRSGRMVGMWHDDGPDWNRRRFRLEDVETDQPLQVTCALAKGYSWHGPVVLEVARRNWSGEVTVHPPRDFAKEISEGTVQVTVNLAGGARRTVPVSFLEDAGAVPRAAGLERSIIIVGGSPADEVALNPQPLPPKVLDRLRGALGEDSAIIVVGGKPGEESSLNPQPLPPKWREEIVGRLGGGKAGVVLQGRMDSMGEVLIGQARVSEDRADLGLTGGLGRFLRRVEGLSTEALSTEALSVEAVSSQALSVEGLSASTQRLGGHYAESGTPEVAAPVLGESAVHTAVDRFGDLVATSIDPDVLIPDVKNPSGYGTARGIDFRVRVEG